MSDEELQHHEAIESLRIESKTPRTDAEIISKRLNPSVSGCDSWIDLARSLEFEIAALKEELSGGVHSCHENCDRPACKLRREVEELKRLLGNETQDVNMLSEKLDAYERANAAMRENLRNIESLTDNPHNPLMGTIHQLALRSLSHDAGKDYVKREVLEALLNYRDDGEGREWQKAVKAAEQELERTKPE